MATTYTFTLVPTWGSVGSFVRRGTGGTRNGTVTDPNGASVTVVQGGVSQAGFLLPDSSGVVSFTTTDVPTVLVDFGAGPVTVNATNAVTANMTAAANAQSAAASAAASAALVGAPADSAIAAALGNSASQSAQAGDARWALKAAALDPVTPLVGKLDQRQSNAVLAVLGDSTGVPPTTGKWVDALALLIGARWKACKVTTRLQSGAVYPAPTTVASGSLSRTVASDTFTRTSADLIGSTPNTGGNWTSTSTGKYTVDGSKALFTNGSTGVTAQRLPAIAAGRLKTSVSLTCIHDGGTHAGAYQVLSSYVDASNFVWIQATLNATPSIKCMVSTTGGGTVTVKTFTAAECGLTTSLSAQTFPVSIEHTTDGKIIFTFNTGTYTHTLSGGDDTTFAAGTQGGFWSAVNDHSWDNITISTSAPPVTTLDIYNGSASSTDATWPNGAAGRLANLLPVAPDVVFISYGHNHGTQDPATFQGQVDTLVSAIRGLYAGCPIVIVGQNHEKSPATNRAYHNAREQAKRAWAKSKGYGYLPAFETILSKDFPDDYIQSDGVHPTTSGTADGGQTWGQAAMDYLTSHSALTLT